MASSGWDFLAWLSFFSFLFFFDFLTILTSFWKLVALVCNQPWSLLFSLKERIDKLIPNVASRKVWSPGNLAGRRVSYLLHQLGTFAYVHCFHIPTQIDKQAIATRALKQTCTETNDPATSSTRNTIISYLSEDAKSVCGVFPDVQCMRSVLLMFFFLPIRSYILRTYYRVFSKESHWGSEKIFSKGYISQNLCYNFGKLPSNVFKKIEVVWWHACRTPILPPKSDFWIP